MESEEANHRVRAPLGLVEGFVAALASGDRAGVLSASAPDVEFRIMTVPEAIVVGEDGRDVFRGVRRTIRGHGELAQLVTSVAFTFQSLAIQNLRGLVDGDGRSVAIEYDAEGRTALGNPYANSYCGFTELDTSGLIQRYHEYLDPGPLARAISDLMAVGVHQKRA